MKMVSLRVSKTTPTDLINSWLKDNVGEENTRYWVVRGVLSHDHNMNGVRDNLYYFDFEEDATAFYLRWVGVEQ